MIFLFRNSLLLAESIKFYGKPSLKCSLDRIKKKDNSPIMNKMNEQRNSQRWKIFDAIPPAPPLPSICFTRTGCLLACTCRTECWKEYVCVWVCVSLTGTNNPMHLQRCRNGALLHNTVTSKLNKMCACSIRTVHPHLCSSRLSADDTTDGGEAERSLILSELSLNLILVLNANPIKPPFISFALNNHNRRLWRAHW